MAEPEIPEGVAKHVKDAMVRLQQAGLPYKPGDFIDKDYQVYGLLGAGYFGVVYLVYSHGVKWLYALKTFRDEYLDIAGIKEQFRKEAYAWVKLDRHPYLVQAYFVEEIRGRLYVTMEYIATDNERGLNSLEHYLKRQPPDLAQTLRWAIQFCHGMEYAYSRGIRCHGDIKPDNIMISYNKTVKISDFGLARVVGDARGTGWEVIGYTAPEGGVDERSDIYSFGIVLWQMTTGSTSPPTREGGHIPSVNGPMQAIIQYCLEKKPKHRYQTFEALRKDLECLLKRETGEVIEPPKLDKLEAWELVGKGTFFNTLGRFEEAIPCFDKAIEFNPMDAVAWNGKGNSLNRLGRFEEAICCYDKAIELDQRSAIAWSNKGNCFNRLGYFILAIFCFDKALELDSKLELAWGNKGESLIQLGCVEDAIHCSEKATELDPGYIAAWYNKGLCLAGQDHFEDAIHCCKKVIELDPLLASAWFIKGLAEDKLGRRMDAVRSYKQFIALPPTCANPADIPAQYAEQIQYARQRLRELEGMK